MMRIRIWPAAMVLFAGAASAARAPLPHACQTGRIMSVRAPLFVLATARADTVRAGPGPVAYNVGDTAGLESIHGQRFRLDGVGGDVPAELEDAQTEAVLVPYGWECRETWRWREARWAEPGAQVFIDAKLRPREQWADGLPTFDVELVHDWYPDSYAGRLESDSVEMMTPAQVFELHQALPTFTPAREAPGPAYAPLLAWARGNPSLAARFPATQALEEALEALQPCLNAYDPHPVAGTYQMTVVIRGADTLQIYLRTDARGYPECGPPERRLDSAVVRPRPAGLARLYVHGAQDAAMIPRTNADAWNAATACGVGSVDVVNPPRTDAGGRRAWEADYNYLALPACFRDQPRVKAATDSLFAAYQAGERDNPPGWFREHADGGVRFEQRWRARGRVVLEMTGTRVSVETVPYR